MASVQTAPRRPPGGDGRLLAHEGAKRRRPATDDLGCRIASVLHAHVLAAAAERRGVGMRALPRRGRDVMVMQALRIGGNVMVVRTAAAGAVATKPDRASPNARRTAANRHEI